ncbi:CRISPR-associated Cas1 family protein [Halomonas sp. GFAJ-1]|nr:CRISPR-associated Cas1 family protein [Halomonas sp. GFAJ-1]
MSRVILDRRKLSLEYTTDCLIIREPEQPPRSLPLSRMTQLICMHSVQVTTQLVGQLLQRGIDFIVVNQRHADNSFSLYANHSQQAHRRSVQYHWQSHANDRLIWSRHLVSHKLKVTASVLRAQGETANTPYTSIMTGVTQVLDTPNEATLRGWEGNARNPCLPSGAKNCLPRWGFSSASAARRQTRSTRLFRSAMCWLMKKAFVNSKKWGSTQS